MTLYTLYAILYPSRGDNLSKSNLMKIRFKTPKAHCEGAGVPVTDEMTAEVVYHKVPSQSAIKEHECVIEFGKHKQFTIYGDEVLEVIK